MITGGLYKANVIKEDTLTSGEWEVNGKQVINLINTINYCLTPSLIFWISELGTDYYWLQS